VEQGTTPVVDVRPNVRFGTIVHDRRGCRLDAFVEEARGRGARRIWVASYDFQAPGMYEKAGLKPMAEFEGWPEGYLNVALCKTL
jgi:hypothetical protein